MSKVDCNSTNKNNINHQKKTVENRNNRRDIMRKVACNVGSAEKYQ